MAELEAKWGEGCWVTNPALLFHSPAGRLWLLLPKSRQKLLRISLRGQAIVANNVLSGSRVPPALERGKVAISRVLKVPNPFEGIGSLEFLTHLGEQVAEHLQQYTNMLTEINESVKSWGGTGESAVTRNYLCGPMSPFKFVVSKLGETLRTVYRAIANGDLNLQMVIDLGLSLGYTKELSRSGMSVRRYKRLLDRRNKKSLVFW